jgi:hypothetical protein
VPLIYGQGLSQAQRIANHAFLQSTLPTTPITMPPGYLELEVPISSPAISGIRYGTLLNASRANEVVLEGAGEGQTFIDLYPKVATFDYAHFYIQSTTKRDGTVRMGGFSLIGPDQPDPVIYPYPVPGATKDNTYFIKHQCTNDTQNMIGHPGEIIRCYHMTSLPGCKLGAIFGTSSGSYSYIEFEDCEFRANHQIFELFGAGKYSYQPLGKRMVCRRVHPRTVYAQGPGAEITGQGGNAIYKHPSTGLIWEDSEFGTPGGETTEGIWERSIYENGGHQGDYVGTELRRLLLHYNAYQGIKLQNTDGNQAILEDLDIRSGYHALLCNRPTIMRRCKIQQGDITVNDAVHLEMEDTILGDGVTTYRYPPSQYSNGAAQEIQSSISVTTAGAKVTMRRSKVYFGGGRLYGVNTSTGGEIQGKENSEVIKTDSVASSGAWGVSSGGIMQLENCKASGDVRPFYFSRPLLARVIEQCDFSAALQAHRVFDADPLTTFVDSTCKLPDLAATIDVDTQPQRWQAYAATVTVASAATLNLTPGIGNRFNVTGATAISNLHMKASTANLLYDTQMVTLIGPVTLQNTGNIVPLFTGTRLVGGLTVLRYDAATLKWYEITSPPRSIVIQSITYPTQPSEFLQVTFYDTGSPAAAWVPIADVTLGGVDRVVVYDGDFRGSFRAHSTLTGAGTQASPYVLRFRPELGWPRTSCDLHLAVEDARAVNLSVTTAPNSKRAKLVARVGSDGETGWGARLSADLGGQRERLVVYADGAFHGRFLGGTVVGRGDNAEPFVFDVLPSGGWGVVSSFHATATDTGAIP